MFRTIATIAFLVLLGSAAPQAQQAPLQPSPVKRTILQKADVPGTNLEVIYATVEIAPGFKAGRHSHPGVVMAPGRRGRILVRTGRPAREDFQGRRSVDRSGPRHP